MSRTVNSLGVAQYLGPRDSDLGVGYAVHDTGAERTLIIDFDADNLPTYSSNDATVPVIPAYSFVVSARLYASEAFTIGSADTVEVGLYQADGTVVDKDGLLAAGAAPGANTWRVGAGALVGASTGANDAQVKVSGTAADANITAGRGQLIIKYIPALG